MHRVIRCVVAVVAAVCLAGCASLVEDRLEPWIGATEQDLIAHWGLPDYEIGDGAGGRILIYEEVVERVDRDRDYDYGYHHHDGHHGGHVTVYGPGDETETVRRIVKRRSFYVNPDGIVYDFAWKGY